MSKHTLIPYHSFSRNDLLSENFLDEVHQKQALLRSEQDVAVCFTAGFGEESLKEGTIFLNVLTQATKCYTIFGLFLPKPSVLRVVLLKFLVIIARNHNLRKMWNERPLI